MIILLFTLPSVNYEVRDDETGIYYTHVLCLSPIILIFAKRTNVDLLLTDRYKQVLKRVR